MSCLVLQIILTHEVTEHHPAAANASPVGQQSHSSIWKLSLSAELSKVRILSSAMAALGGQRIPFESVSRLGLCCHSMVISLMSSFRFFETSAVIRTASLQKLPTDLQSSSESYRNPFLLAAITDILYP